MRQNDELHMIRDRNGRLETELEAIRGDLSFRVAEQKKELEVQQEVFREGRKEAGSLLDELRDSQVATKSLKSQNLDLQYLLSSLGVPLASDSKAVLFDAFDDGSNHFFPSVTPLNPEVDPAPVVLRGDLQLFHLTNVLTFLENSKRVGVLTVLTEGFVTRLYLDGSSLRLACWNKQDPVFSLAGLLVDAELLTEEQVASYVKDRLYDYEVAGRLLQDDVLDDDTLQAGLREHTRVIVTELFHLDEGTFVFQEGRIVCDGRLLFNLSVTNLLLRTAARVDERSRGAETGEEVNEKEGAEEAELEV